MASSVFPERLLDGEVGLLVSPGQLVSRVTNAGPPDISSFLPQTILLYPRELLAFHVMSPVL